jgi:hypothetical protein
MVTIETMVNSPIDAYYGNHCNYGRNGNFTYCLILLLVTMLATLTMVNSHILSLLMVNRVTVVIMVTLYFLYDPTATWATIGPTSQVSSFAILLLPSEGNSEI